jgi:hypothetical protein
MPEKFDAIEGLWPSEEKNEEPQNISREAHERLLGLSEDIKFEAKIKEKLRHKFYSFQTKGWAEILNKYNIDIDESNFPEFFKSEWLNDDDWKNISESNIPIITLYAAYYLRLMEEDHDFKKLADCSPQEKRKLQSLPLIHGCTAHALDNILSDGKLISNKEIYRKAKSKSAAVDFEVRSGQTNMWDRELGLDQYVFADFGRPHMYHTQQEVTLVIDPEAINQPGVFMTEKDISDVNQNHPIDDYLRNVSVPKYFYRMAELRIAKTEIERRERRSGGMSTYSCLHNTIDKFSQGQDGDVDMFGKPTFSTWEVKLPSISADMIKRIIVRDEETFKVLRDKYSSKFEIVYEPKLEPKNYGSLQFATVSNLEPNVIN